MIWTREQYLDHMTFTRSNGELFVSLFEQLGQCRREWAQQGATEDELSQRAFGWDSVKYALLPVNNFAITGLKPYVISDNAKERIFKDGMGRTMKLCKETADIPLPVDFVVKTEDDWRKIKHWFEFREDRVDHEKLKQLSKAQKEGTMIVAAIGSGLPGGFDLPRELMGEENLCYAYYDMPEMIQDMLDTFADTALKVFERVSDYVTIDMLHVHEDMAGKSGPLIGNSQIREFLHPYYHKVWDPLKDRGARLFAQDSDGNMESVIDAFLECGLNYMYPCEPKAGMDIVKLRQKYGKKLAFQGGIDKFALCGTKEDIRRELEYKIRPELLGGGMIWGIDHQVPNGVSLENYWYFVNLGREMLGLPPAEPCDWVRMAF